MPCLIMPARFCTCSLVTFPFLQVCPSVNMLFINGWSLSSDAQKSASGVSCLSNSIQSFLSSSPSSFGSDEKISVLYVEHGRELLGVVTAENESAEGFTESLCGCALCLPFCHAGFVNLKGHRSVGGNPSCHCAGVRSVYPAAPSPGEIRHV